MGLYFLLNHYIVMFIIMLLHNVLEVNIATTELRLFKTQLL